MPKHRGERITCDSSCDRLIEQHCRTHVVCVTGSGQLFALKSRAKRRQQHGFTLTPVKQTGSRPLLFSGFVDTAVPDDDTASTDRLLQSLKQILSYGQRPLLPEKFKRSVSFVIMTTP